MARRWQHVWAAALALSTGCFESNPPPAGAAPPNCTGLACLARDGGTPASAGTGGDPMRRDAEPSQRDGGPVPMDASLPDARVPPVSPGCGNGVLDLGENCDGELFARPRSCASLLGDGVTGLLECTAACMIDSSACGLADAGPIASCIDLGESASPDHFGSYNSFCQGCVCDRCHRSYVSACDEACWELIECTAFACGQLTGFERARCVIDACADLADAAPAVEPFTTCAFSGEADDCTHRCYAIEGGDAG